MKIANKILILFIAAAIVLAGGGSQLLYLNLRSTLVEEAGQRQITISKNILEEIDIYLFERQQNIKTIGQAPLIINEISSGTFTPGERGKKRIDQFFNSTGPWDQLLILDARGKIRISTPETNDKNIAQMPDMGAAFQAAMKGETYYSDVVRSSGTGRPTMIFAYPIRNDDAPGSPIVGAAIGELAWPAVVEYLEKFQEPFLVHLYNAEGFLIGGNTNDSKEKILNPEYRNSQLLRSASAANAGSKTQPGINDTMEVLATYANEDGHLNYKGNRWILVFETPVSTAFASIQAKAWAAGLIFFASSIAFIIFLYVVANKVFVSPIIEIASAMKKRAEGDRTARIKVLSKDEVGQLSTAFNQMADTLNDFYRRLEDKVRERTEALARQNKKLERTQKEMADLIEQLHVEKDTAVKEKSIDDAILTGIGDGVFVLDIEERIILFNPIAEKISGFSANEAIGRPYTEILRFVFEKGGEVNDVFIKEAMGKGRIAQMANHTLLIRKDGGTVPVADSAAPIRNSAGNIFGCVVVFRDVTKERDIDQMKSEFVSVASHQLRTPLTGIKWFTELLLKRKPTKAIRNYIDQISISNERMIRLVDDLLNVSHIETGKKFDIAIKETDIVPIVKNVIQEQATSAKQKNISITCAKDAPRKLVLPIDELKIRQVFQNLVSNAIKYSKNDSNVTLGCQQQNEKEIVFYVKDTGIGIPAHQQNQVFSKFFRAENVFTMHTDGTGLGLYIVKAIVEAHGGNVWFESEENKGTIFYISLPLHPKTPADVPPRAA